KSQAATPVRSSTPAEWRERGDSRVGDSSLLTLPKRKARRQGKSRNGAGTSWKMDDGDTHRLKAGNVQDFVAIEIVDLAVGYEIEVRAANRAGGGQDANGRAEFQDSKLADARSIGGQFLKG